MRKPLASVLHEDGIDRVERAVRALEERWRHGEPDLKSCWAAHDPRATTSVLAALVKADLRCRFARGRRPAVNDYLDRFPVLRGESERVLSLIYEEFCLREEQGERPDPDSFCRCYEPWRDSLASQLKYHHLLSRVVGPPTAPPRFPEPGDHFQEYAIDSVLGQGGAARVYHARNDLLGGREVALKVSADRGQEPSILGRLDHEHIVPVHSVVFQAETQLRGLIMPYRPGLPLDEVIHRVDPASRPRSARILWEVVAASAPTDAQALKTRLGWGTFPMPGTYPQGVAWVVATLAGAVAYAHAHGIHHRDIKPANVLLTLSNGPQLLDFNLAHEPHAADQAEAALRGGTLPYMAPEQLEAFMDPERWASVDTPADLYSLGLVMYELLTGQAPEVPDQSLPLPRAIRSLLDRRADLRFAPRQFNPAIPHALEAITIRCLAYSEADRYPSAQALADDLNRFLRGQPLRHAINPCVSERLGSWSRRNVLALAIGTVAALAGVVGSGAVIEHLTPIEQREAFRAALTALDTGENERAIGLLEPLAKQLPHSALVLFCMSAALAQGGQIDKAAGRYTRARTEPNADAILTGWGRRTEGAVRRFESLGLALSKTSKTNKFDPNSPPLYPPDLAQAALSTAILLGSRDPDVFLNAAVNDEVRRAYVAAIEKLTRLIELIERSPSRDTREMRLSKYIGYEVLARVLIKVGNERKASGTQPAFIDAGVWFNKAISVLDRGDRIEKKGLPEKLSNSYYRVKAEIALCDLAIRQNNRAEAEEYYERAKKIIRDPASALSADNYKRLGMELDDVGRRIAEAEIALCDLAIRQNNRAEAEGHHERAAMIIAEAEEHYERTRKSKRDPESARLADVYKRLKGELDGLGRKIEEMSSSPPV